MVHFRDDSMWCIFHMSSSRVSRLVTFLVIHINDVLYLISIKLLKKSHSAMTSKSGTKIFSAPVVRIVYVNLKCQS